jgi:16S rRNA (guanine1207-N2)-methyltransferase
MSDLSFHLLSQVINAQGGAETLWVVDENISTQEMAAIRPVESMVAMTNRYDTYQQLVANGFNAQLSDFDFSPFVDKKLQTVFYRVSKEKAIVHHVINNAGKYLAEDGGLYLAGYKQEGIKTYVDKAEAYLGSLVTKERGGKTSLLAHIEKTNSQGLLLDDRNYSEFSELGGPLAMQTKPGVFGWNKIDKGSEFLIETLPIFIESLSATPKSIIDLGCGYGYLSLMASKMLAARYVATDNNVAAVSSCKENFKKFDVEGEVILDDCASGIKQKFDVVLCNPPFHQGFDVDNDLTDKFLSAARRLLKPEGKALFVVNGFIPLERKAAAYFSDITMLASNCSFKLVSVSP